MRIIRQLEEQLRKASKAYYEGEDSGLSDAEFDALREELELLDPDNPFLKEVGADASSVWPKVEHIRPMGSQKKITTREELDKWRDKYTGGGPLFWSEKLDGSSLELIYDNGCMLQGITRGTGFVGDDITPNIAFMQRAPKRLRYEKKIAVRAEIILMLADWEKYLKNPPPPKKPTKNARNAAAGIARRKSGAEDCRHLYIISYDVLALDEPDKFKTKKEVFDFLIQEGFAVPGFGLVSTVAEMQLVKDDYQESRRSKLMYEIDGLIVEDNDLENQKRQGFVDDRPRAARAYKFSSQAVETTIVDVDWQVARTQIAPVAVLEPVELGGVTVSRAQLCNLEEIQRLGVGIGSRVVLSRRNDVIPKIERAVSPGSWDAPIRPPAFCPSCGAPIDFDSMRVYCSGDNCAGSTARVILHYLKALDVKGMGPSQIEEFVESSKVETPLDLYRLSPADFISEKIGVKVLDDLRAKSRDVPLPVFIKSLGLPLFGMGKSKEVIKAIPTLEGLREATREQLEAIPLIGPEVARAAVEGLREKSAYIDELLKYVTIGKPVQASGNSLDGVSFCFTGYRNKEAQVRIEDIGGKVASSVSKNLTYLVLKDVGSTSSKANKARELGVRLLSPDDLDRLLSKG
jgi:DNA ligase (NAD+)